MRHAPVEDLTLFTTAVLQLAKFTIRNAKSKYTINDRVHLMTQEFAHLGKTKDDDQLQKSPTSTPDIDTDKFPPRQIQ